MTDAPLLYRWNGEAMVAEPRFKSRADEQFVIGETYVMEAIEERSARSHRHYFAVINEAWKNLPEKLWERFPTSEHLRKFALIRSGYRDERTFVADSPADAQRLAAWIKPLDGYAVIVVRDRTVFFFTAKSQATRGKDAMKPEEFQRSKDAVLNELAKIIGVEPAILERRAKEA